MVQAWTCRLRGLRFTFVSKVQKESGGLSWLDLLDRCFVPENSPICRRLRSKEFLLTFLVYFSRLEVSLLDGPKLHQNCLIIQESSNVLFLEFSLRVFSRELSSLDSSWLECFRWPNFTEVSWLQCFWLRLLLRSLLGWSFGGSRRACVCLSVRRIPQEAFEKLSGCSQYPATMVFETWQQRTQ